jgi:hypothetical protein
MSGTWIPGEGWIVFGRQPHMLEPPEYVAVHDPNEPVNSPYYVAPPPPMAEPKSQPATLVELTPGQKAEALLRDVLAVDPRLPLGQVGPAQGLGRRSFRPRRRLDDA